MLLRIVLLLFSLPLLAHGGEGLYLAARGRTQQAMTCEDYLRDGARSTWVRITGCELDYVGSGYRSSTNPLSRVLPGRDSTPKIVELLFPMRRAGAPPDEPAALVVSTRDPNVLAIAEGTLNAATSVDQEAFLVTMLQVVTAMGASRDLEGVIRGPLEMLRTRRSVGGIRAPLTRDFAVLDLRERPGLLWPAIATIAGALALLLGLLRRPSASVITRAPAETPAGAPIRLMLLNLPESATAADIEHAPQLGSQQNVRGYLAAAFPGIQFDESGRARVSTAEGSIEVDLASADPVYTAVLTSYGNAGPLLASLLDETGWRAYAPRRGTFVTADNLHEGSGS